MFTLEILDLGVHALAAITRIVQADMGWAPDVQLEKIQTVLRLLDQAGDGAMAMGEAREQIDLLLLEPVPAGDS